MLLNAGVLLGFRVRLRLHPAADFILRAVQKPLDIGAVAVHAHDKQHRGEDAQRHWPKQKIQISTI